MIKGGFDTLNSILKPFLNCVRIPKFKNRDDSKYKNYPSEENMTIYLSSAWLGDDWSYDLYKEHREKMLSGEDWFTCNLPYQLSAYHGLLTKKRIEDIVSSENMSDMSFSMEFEVKMLPIFVKSIANPFNCWKPLKPNSLQRRVKSQA